MKKPLVRVFSRTQPKLIMFGTAQEIDPDFIFEVSEEYSYRKCDVAVLYGARKPHETENRAAIRASIYTEHEGPFVILESGFVGRRFRPPNLLQRAQTFINQKFMHHDPAPEYHRVGIDGAFGDDADFCNKDSPPDRWSSQAAQMGIKIRPYRSSGNHILLIAQVPEDASLRGLNMRTWLVESAIAIRASTARPICIRLHPRTEEPFVLQVREATAAISGVELLPLNERSLEADLRNCWACVTYSSSSSVDALVAGVPPICLSPANIAYEICSKSLADINNPAMPDRDQWFNNLAYAHWTTDEIFAGTPWPHLRPSLIKRLARQGWDFGGDSYAAPHS